VAYTLKELADCVGAFVEGDADLVIHGVADLLTASQDEIAFFANTRYQQQMRDSHAGAIIVAPYVQRNVDQHYLVHEEPSRVFQEIIALFAPHAPPLTGFEGIHPTAVIHPSALLAKGVTIGPYAVVDAHVRIEEGVHIGSHVFIGPYARIGAHSEIHPHAVIREGTVVGSYVVIQPGAVLGSCGYGYVTDKQGEHQKLAHIGNVVLGDHVEIGANTTIDRARFQSTMIGTGTKIDNLVQIAHNVRVGAHCFIISQVGIAGSTIIGNYVVLAGKVAVNGHICIADKVRVAACSGVSKSLKEEGDYRGVPAMPVAMFNRKTVYLRRIEELFQRVSCLESKVGSSV